jgi:hypothetical protein
MTGALRAINLALIGFLGNAVIFAAPAPAHADPIAQPKIECHFSDNQNPTHRICTFRDSSGNHPIALKCYHLTVSPLALCEALNTSLKGKGWFNVDLPWTASDISNWKALHHSSASRSPVSIAANPKSEISPKEATACFQKLNDVYDQNVYPAGYMPVPGKFKNQSGVFVFANGNASFYAGVTPLDGVYLPFARKTPKAFYPASSEQSGVMTTQAKGYLALYLSERLQKVVSLIDSGSNAHISPPNAQRINAAITACKAVVSEPMISTLASGAADRAQALLQRTPTESSDANRNAGLAEP